MARFLVQPIPNKLPELLINLSSQSYIRSRGSEPTDEKYKSGERWVRVRVPGFQAGIGLNHRRREERKSKIFPSLLFIFPSLILLFL